MRPRNRDQNKPHLALCFNKNRMFLTSDIKNNMVVDHKRLTMNRYDQKVRLGVCTHKLK